MGSNIAELLRKRGDTDAGNMQTLADDSLKKGKRWTFREEFDLNTADADIVIANDFDSDALRVVAVTFASDDTLSGTVTENPTIDTNGTALNEMNDKMDGTTTSSPAGVVVEQGGTYSGGGNTLPIRTQGGVGSGASRTAVEDVPTAEVRIEPGGGIRHEITDTSGNENTLTFEVIISRR